MSTSAAVGTGCRFTAGDRELEIWPEEVLTRFLARRAGVTEAGSVLLIEQWVRAGTCQRHIDWVMAEAKQQEQEEEEKRLRGEL